LARNELGILEWVWIDTCCIDKSSSAELSEAINSMFRYYQNAVKFYAYLADVPSNDNVRSADSAFVYSRWFTRGWTLQELIASKRVFFYSQDWVQLGSRYDLCAQIASITGIAAEVLVGAEQSPTKDFRTSSIAQRMSWASKRRTTRLEDIAYCLMGLFDVNMPLLYGEGTKAFLRLQEEILKRSNDNTLFAWHILPVIKTPDVSWGWKQTEVEAIGTGGFLAPNPSAFRYSDPYMAINNTNAGIGHPYTMTNMGLCIDLPIFPIPSGRDGQCVAVLNCVSSLDVQGTLSDLIGIHVTVTQSSQETHLSKRVFVVVRDPFQRPIRLRVTGWSSLDSQRWAVVEWNPRFGPGLGQPLPVKAFVSTLYIPQHEPFRAGKDEKTTLGLRQRTHVFQSVADKKDAQYFS